MRFRRFLIFALPFFLCACNYGWYIFVNESESVDERASSIPNLKEVCPDAIPDFSDEKFKEKYSFLLIADPHDGSQLYDLKKAEFLNKFDEVLSSPDEWKIPRFAVCLGDNADGGWAIEHKELNEFFDEIAEKAKSKGAVEKASDFKWLSIVGNHDLYHDGWHNFKETEEPMVSLAKAGKMSSAYRFDDGAFSWYFLDSGSGTLGDVQRSIFKDLLEKDEKPKLVFSHIPFYAGGNFIMTMQDTMERNILLTLFKKNDVEQIFCGHAHSRYGYDYGGWREDVFDAFGVHRKFYIVTVDKKDKKIDFKEYDF